MTDLQDFCQEHRTMEELVDAGYKPYSVYNAEFLGAQPARAGQDY